MLIVGDIIIAETQNTIVEENHYSSIDYYSWFEDVFNAGCGYYNITIIALKYCSFVLGREISETYVTDFENLFGDEAVRSVYRDFDDFYEVIMDII